MIWLAITLCVLVFAVVLLLSLRRMRKLDEKQHRSGPPWRNPTAPEPEYLGEFSPKHDPEV